MAEPDYDALLKRLDYEVDATIAASREYDRRCFADAAAAIRALLRQLAELRASLIELQPDPVLVEDSWIPVAEWPTILGNYMRSSAENAREAKQLSIDLTAARNEIARLNGQTISFDLASHSSTHLRTLADECERIITERGNDGVFS